PKRRRGEMGSAVAISGDTVVASASGAVHVFVRSADLWQYQANLKDVFTIGNAGGFPGVITLAMSGNTVVVGNGWDDGSGTGVNPVVDDDAPFSGAAYVFRRTGSVWIQEAYLKASNTGTRDDFGWAVAVAGNTIVVGASGESGSGTGVNPSSNENAPGAGAA